MARSQSCTAPKSSDGCELPTLIEPSLNVEKAEPDLPFIGSAKKTQLCTSPQGSEPKENQTQQETVQTTYHTRASGEVITSPPHGPTVNGRTVVATADSNKRSDTLEDKEGLPPIQSGSSEISSSSDTSVLLAPLNTSTQKEMVSECSTAGMSIKHQQFTDSTGSNSDISRRELATVARDSNSEINEGEEAVEENVDDVRLIEEKCSKSELTTSSSECTQHTTGNAAQGVAMDSNNELHLPKPTEGCIQDEDTQICRYRTGSDAEDHSDNETIQSCGDPDSHCRPHCVDPTKGKGGSIKDHRLVRQSFVEQKSAMVGMKYGCVWKISAAKEFTVPVLHLLWEHCACCQSLSLMLMFFSIQGLFKHKGHADPSSRLIDGKIGI